MRLASDKVHVIGLNPGGVVTTKRTATIKRDASGDFVFDPATATRDLVHLGSYFVPMGDAAGFHHVYTQPGVPEAWRRDGAFPDGTVLTPADHAALGARLGV